MDYKSSPRYSDFQYEIDEILKKFEKAEVLKISESLINININDLNLKFSQDLISDDGKNILYNRN